MQGRSLAARQDRVAILVSWNTTTEQVKRFWAGVPQLVPMAWRNRDGVAGLNLTDLAFDANSSGAARDKVNFLGFRMKMFLGAGAREQAGLSEALAANGGVSISQQLPDFRAVFRGEGGDFA